MRTDIPNADSSLARRISLRANRIAEVDLAWNPEVLASIAEVDPDVLKGTFTDKELAEILSQTGVEPKDAEPQVDKAEELREKWQTETGQLWLIGNHRLLCGDATKKEDVARVCGGKGIDVVFTDPPYGIDLIKGDVGRVGGGTKEYPTRAFSAVANDDRPFDPRPLLDLADSCVIWGGNYFADKLPPARCWLVWDKAHPVERTFAGCELAWTNLDRHAKVYKVAWDGWTKEGEDGSKLHPTQKPVKLFSLAIEDSCKRGDVILDVYTGSGTTLVAAENLNRKCYAIEISPAYVAVCLERMATAFPGIKIEKAN